MQSRYFAQQRKKERFVKYVNMHFIAASFHSDLNSILLRSCLQLAMIHNPSIQPQLHLILGSTF